MAWIRSVFLLAATISIAEAKVSRQPTNIVLKCETNGYAFSGKLAKTQGTNHAQTVDITIGDGTDADCFKNNNVVNSLQDVPFSFTISTYGTVANGKCGTPSKLDTSSEAHISYTTKARFFIREVERQVIQRVYIYDYTLTCKLDRVKTVSSPQSFTLDSIVDEPDVMEDVTDKMGFTAEINFVNSLTDPTPKGASFITTSSGTVYLQVKESQPAFKATVQSCFASTAADPFNPGGNLVDELYHKGCPISQKDVQVTDKSAGAVSEYVLSIRSFFIFGERNSAVHFACKVYVCDKDEDAIVHDGKCALKTTQQCKTFLEDTDYWDKYWDDLFAKKRRRRRGVVDSEVDDLQRNVIVMANQKFFIHSDPYNVACPHPYVYDTVSEKCTKERLLEIKGLRLDISWGPEYANTSSGEYKILLKRLSFQLFSLVKGSGHDKIIPGLRITRITKGSVIVDVLITYSEDVQATEAFETFRKVMYDRNTQMIRILRLLRIREENEEFQLVPVVFRDNTVTDQRLVILVVIAVAALLVVLLLAVAYYQVQKMRQRVATRTQSVIGQENSAVEKIPI